MKKTLFFSLALACLSFLNAEAQPMDNPAAQQWRSDVTAAECSFAASMARRDLAAFERHLSEQALFFGGGEVLRGKAAVLSEWRAHFVAPLAPFSWAPDEVVVSPDGSLAHSTGLVRSPSGALLMRFNSVWRQESPGVWRVVIDRASPLTAAERGAEIKPAASAC
ncbi:YybH family protein [Roseateles oligotrophus]|uniref:Nuclear transport factor 2 family protein n=1 Tax=Roseateles oligotrophus TaxID=1769250 RepID=A0ABT2YG73_9BURK|nr:nuclear transport factor 2 family protein [Roseateles oligotrophus]MCV2369056.1 nuclear transport factor 2 family protein [Roseateles oligotrophus]